MNRQASNALTLSVPTPEMYNGDFSNWVDSQGPAASPIYDPATTRPNPNGTGFIRDPFPGNLIPANRFSAVARQYLALARIGGRPESRRARARHIRLCLEQLSVAGRDDDGNDQQIQREDRSHAQQPASRCRTSSTGRRNGCEPGPTGAAGLPAPFNDFQPSSFDGDLHRASWDWIGVADGESPDRRHRTPSTRTRSRRMSIRTGGTRSAFRMRSTATRTSASSRSPSSRRGAASSYNGTEQPRFSIKDDLTLSRGSHTFKSGFTFDRQQANGFGQQDYRRPGRLQLPGDRRPGRDDACQPAAARSRRSCSARRHGRTETIRYLQQIYPYYGFYAQDDWRMNDKLVLNYGVRYEFTQPPVAGGDQYSDFSPTKPNPGGQQLSRRAGVCRRRPGTRRARAACSRLLRGAGAARRASPTAPTTRRRFRGGVGRSFGRVTVIAEQQPLRRIHRPVRVRVTATPASRRRSSWIRGCRRIRCRR